MKIKVTKQSAVRLSSGRTIVFRPDGPNRGAYSVPKPTGDQLIAMGNATALKGAEVEETQNGDR